MTDTIFDKLARYYDTELVEPLRGQLIGRKLVSVNPKIKGEEIKNVDINTLTDMGAGTISYNIDTNQLNRDNIAISTSNVEIPYLFRGYEIPKKEYETFKAKGISEDSAAMLSAAQAVGEKEDAMIIQGWSPNGSTYEINGLYQGAGNTDATANDFGAYGKPTIAITSAIELMNADNVYGSDWNVVLNSTQYWKLQRSRNGTSGLRELPDIEALIGKGGIYYSSNITVGTGMVTAYDPNRKYFDLVIPADIQNDVGMDSRQPKLSPIYGVVYELARLRIKNSAAICTMTAI